MSPAAAGHPRTDADLPDLIEGIEVDALRARARALLGATACRASVARRVASLGAIHPASTSSRSRWRGARRSAQAARVYFGLGAALGLDWIRGEIERLPVEGHWQALARGTLREEAYLLQRRLADQVLAPRPRGDAREAHRRLARGPAARPIDNLSRTVREMRATGSADFPTLSVALQAVRRLAER